MLPKISITYLKGIKYNNRVAVKSTNIAKDDSQGTVKLNTLLNKIKLMRNISEKNTSIT